MTTERAKRRVTAIALCAFIAFVATTSPACSARFVDEATLPTELREPYALFRVRCSKCHTIARPLNAPVRDATHWELYVARMRRVPGSGINETDAREILRFLVYYTEVVRGNAEATGTEPLPLEEGEAPPEILEPEPPADQVTPAATIEPATSEEVTDVAAE
jgi:hypothetical protein